MNQKIAFGGGCHWCTEAVFQSLAGVSRVQQGFIASTGENNSFSEAVIVHFQDGLISLRDLIGVHLHTHASTSDHVMRIKYRSAIYTFSSKQSNEVEHLLRLFQEEFDNRLVTKVYSFREFRPSEEEFRNYYYSDQNKPFCVRYINPKLQIILTKYHSRVKTSCKNALALGS